jgi:hypothetical protein
MLLLGQRDANSELKSAVVKSRHVSGNQLEPLHSNEGLIAQSQTRGRFADHVTVFYPQSIRPRAIKNNLALCGKPNLGAR